MEGHLNNFRDEIERFQFWFAESAGHFVFEKFCYRPKYGADDRADEPHVSKQLSFDPCIEPAIEIDVSAILHPHRRRTDFEVIRMNNAVAHHKGGSCRAGTTAAESGHKAVE